MDVRFDILGLGCVAVDDLLYVDAYPPPDSKVRVQRRERQCGGLTATALVTASRLGAACAYAATLGTDELSEFAVERLRAEGVDVGGVRRVAGARPIHSVIVVDTTNHTRNVFSDTAGFEASQKGLDPAVVRGARVVLVDHVNPAGQVAGARAARQAGTPVVADFEKDTGLGFEDLLPWVDHLVIPADFARRLTDREELAEAVTWLLPGRSCVVVTDGARGAWFAAAGDARATHVPGFAVNVLDTTGCGDVFHGAYAMGLARGFPAAERVRYACAVAALKAMRPGGQAGIPNVEEVARFMGRQGKG
jgi:ribokinase